MTQKNSCCPVSGTQDANFAMHRTSASSQGTSRVASLWNSIKGVLGYASVTVLFYKIRFLVLDMLIHSIKRRDVP